MGGMYTFLNIYTNTVNTVWSFMQGACIPLVLIYLTNCISILSSKYFVLFIHFASLYT